jgi:hypothetical protein
MRKNETKLTPFPIIILLLLSVVNHEALSQKLTEVFIPLGKSPGVSGKMTTVGKVEDIRRGSYAMTITQSDKSNATIKAETSTVIYLDRSNLTQPSTTGKWEDIRPGLMIEAKYKDESKRGPIEWIKVQMK